MKNYIFIDGINDNSRLVGYNRINEPSPEILRCASVFKDNGLNAHYLHYDTSTLAQLRILYSEDKCILVKANRYNWNAVKSLIVSIGAKMTEVVVICVDDDLADVNQDGYEIVKFDENFPETKFFENVASVCSVKLRISYSAIDYSLGVPYHDKSIRIKIGRGCPRGCFFCKILPGDFEYRNITSVSGEIASVLKEGVRYFHVEDHSFANDAAFIWSFCEMTSGYLKRFDFVWSCFVMPEMFVKDMDLLNTMYKGGLRKIVIGTENVSDSLQKELNIPNCGEDTIKIVQQAVKSGIRAIDINLIIGSPGETMETLKEKEEFIDKVLGLSNGLSDFRFHYYCPPGSSCHESLYPYSAPVSPIDRLTKTELQIWKQKMDSYIYNVQKSKVPLLALESRHSVCRLSNYSIYTDVFIHTLSKSSLPNMCGQFQYYSYNLNKKQIELCVPFFCGEALEVENEGLVINIDQCLKKDGSDFLRLPIKYDCLIEILKQRLTLRDIIDRLKDTLSADDIVEVLKVLEYNHLLYYIKTL
jgi:hypothetical protein